MAWDDPYYVPNVEPSLSKLSGAVQDYRAQQQRKAIGEAAATGKLSDAAGVAFKQGNVKTGLALKELNDEQREKVRERIGKAALNADTPEKWGALQNFVATEFPDAEPLEDFSEREGVVSMYRDYYKDRDDARAERTLSLQNSRAAADDARADRLLAIRERESNAKLSGRGRADLNVIDKKEIFEAEDKVTSLDHTIENLKAAKEVSKRAFEGTGAGFKATLGAKVPGGSFLVDEDKAEATLDYEKIMTPEALANMAATLKGATTDQEMSRYIDLISDPSTPIDVRNRTIDRMIKLAERQAALANERINEIRNDEYFVPGGGLSEGGGKPKADNKDDPLGLR